MSASHDGSLGRVAVVDRPGWIRANVDGFRVVLEPLVEQLRERAPGGAAASKPGGVVTAVGSRVTGIQAGLILAYLSSRVLGQYELFLPPETSPVDGGSLIDAVATPRQKEIMDRLTSVMTLVEGHGDYVMDAVGPQVVPSVEQIRERFNARRGSNGRIEQTIRRILGIDLKMKQYAEGSRFVKAVVDEVGMAEFNKVWTSPETLPTREEFAHPHQWVERVVSGA